ncbi:MAG: cupin domain-containing protein [Flavobacteriaceae bacterium]|nr:cupin domain-containing protein [Flavobacteriaceae bacterium]
MKNLKTFIIAALSFALFNSIAASENKSNLAPTKAVRGSVENEAETILKNFVTDYTNDRYASEKRAVGIEVPEQGSWTLTVTGKKNAGKWEVLLNDGLPKIPTYIYTIEFETLKAIDAGKINALTAQGKAFSSDYTPMSVREMEGFLPTEMDDSNLNAFSFHFWTRGFPEVIPFREDATRRAHGSNFVVFYYEKGLRTAWYKILPGERVRDDAREQAAPFPMMGITIKGTIEGIVDGERVTVSEGNTVFIPANVAHKWWNDKDEPVEVVLIMFGEGA